MKKMKWSIVCLACSAMLLFAAEAMAWHFEVLGNEVWESAGQTLSSAQNVNVSSGFNTQITGYDSEVYDGITHYDFWTGGDVWWGDPSRTRTLDTTYRVVSDWGVTAGEPPVVNLNRNINFQVDGMSGELYSSDNMSNLMNSYYNSEWWGEGGFEIYSQASYEFYTNDIGSDNFVESGDDGDLWASETISDAISIEAVSTYDLHASVGASINNEMMGEGGLWGITDDDLIAAGFVDDNGNADPDAVIDEWFQRQTDTTASLDFSLTIDTEETAPGYVPPAVDPEDGAVTTDNVGDPMVPGDGDSIDENGTPVWTFDDFWVQEDELYAFDPTYAIGYIYEMDQASIDNGIYFDELLLVLGSDLDDTYTVSWNGGNQEISLYDGFGVGTNPFNFQGDLVSTFTIYGIEWDAQIDPNNQLGFPTLIGFNQPGSPVFTMSPITEYRSPQQPVPEPATMLLFGTGLAGLVGMRKRNGKK